MSITERLTAKRQIVDGCWLWTGPKVEGYGRIYVPGLRSQLTHRVSYEAHRGPIPAGMQIDHLCRNRACFNPDHLEVVTQAENIRRGLSGAHNAVKTHCPYGHEYTPENTMIVNAGRSRACRTCNYARRNAARRGAAA